MAAAVDPVAPAPRSTQEAPQASRRPRAKRRAVGETGVAPAAEPEYVFPPVTTDADLPAPARREERVARPPAPQRAEQAVQRPAPPVDEPIGQDELLDESMHQPWEVAAEPTPAFDETFSAAREPVLDPRDEERAGAGSLLDEFLTEESELSGREAGSAYDESGETDDEDRMGMWRPSRWIGS
jgi:hypothetical protein